MSYNISDKMGLPKMLPKFIKPYLSINNYKQAAYIRDVHSCQEIELIYSNDIKDIDCQLLFYDLKILRKCKNYQDFFHGNHISVIYYLQSI